jgi:hypothetical protein
MLTLTAPSVRKTGDGVQTAVNTYRNANTGHDITIVGTMHIGDATYFRKLSALVSAAQSRGAVVHYESTGEVTDAERQGLSDEELQALKAIEGMDVLQKRLPRFLGLIHQCDSWSRRPEWVNTDMSTVELIRALGVKRLPTGPPDAEKMNEMFDWLGCPCCIPPVVSRSLASAVRFVLRNVSWLTPLASLMRGPVAAWLSKSVIIGERNKIAVAAAVATPRDHPLVMIWGAGHLPGLGRMLKTHGYALCSTDWFTALKS